MCDVGRLRSREVSAAMSCRSMIISPRDSFARPAQIKINWDALNVYLSGAAFRGGHTVIWHSCFPITSLPQDASNVLLDLVIVPFDIFLGQIIVLRPQLMHL